MLESVVEPIVETQTQKFKNEITLKELSNQFQPSKLTEIDFQIIID
jgi:hypothetical protein